MKIEKIFWGGVTVDLNQTPKDIEDYIMAANLTTYESPNINSASVDCDNKCCKITIKRDLEYFVKGNVLMDSDCSLLFGIEPACFGIDPIGKFKAEYAKKGISVPFIPVPIPYAGHWYVGIDEAVERYQELFKMATSTEITKTKIIATDTELKVEFEWK